MTNSSCYVSSYQTVCKDETLDKASAYRHDMLSSRLLRLNPLLSLTNTSN